jgi:hypothetical protein
MPTRGPSLWSQPCDHCLIALASPRLRVNGFAAHRIEEAQQVGKEDKKAVAYLRTSSAANVGADKDSEPMRTNALA